MPQELTDYRPLIRRTRRRAELVDRELDRVQRTPTVPGHEGWATEKRHVCRLLKRRRDLLYRKVARLKQLARVERNPTLQGHLRRLHLCIAIRRVKNINLRLGMLPSAGELGAIFRACVNEQREVLFRRTMIETIDELNTATCKNGRRRFIYANEWQRGCFRLPRATWMADAPLDEESMPNFSTSMFFASTQGTAPSAAIEDLFTSEDCPVAIECMSALHICFLRSYLKLAGPARFDERMDDEMVVIAPGENGSVDPLREPVAVDSVNDLKPGDWVYFYNAPGYVDRHATSPDATWRGANSVYLGVQHGQHVFKTFEDENREITEDQFRQFLFDEYNKTPSGDNGYNNAKRDRVHPKLARVDQVPGLLCPDVIHQGRIYPVYRLKPELLLSS